MEAYIAKVGEVSSTTINATRVAEFVAKGYIHMVEENLDPTMIAQVGGTWAVDNTIRIQQIKDKCGEVIYARLPQWKQANLQGRFTELQFLATTRALTTDELAERDAILAEWAWVKAVRAISDIAEADTNVFVNAVDWTV